MFKKNSNITFFYQSWNSEMNDLIQPFSVDSSLPVDVRIILQLIREEEKIKLIFAFKYCRQNFIYFVRSSHILFFFLKHAIFVRQSYCYKSKKSLPLYCWLPDAPSNIARSFSSQSFINGWFSTLPISVSTSSSPSWKLVAKKQISYPTFIVTQIYYQFCFSFMKNVLFNKCCNDFLEIY